MTATRRLGALTLQRVALAVLAAPVVARHGMTVGPVTRARLEAAARHGIDQPGAFHTFRFRRGGA